MLLRDRALFLERESWCVTLCKSIRSSYPCTLVPGLKEPYSCFEPILVPEVVFPCMSYTELMICVLCPKNLHQSALYFDIPSLTGGCSSGSWEKILYSSVWNFLSLYKA